MDEIKRSLVRAVRDGRVEEVRELINYYGFSYTPAFISQGEYFLLWEAVRCGQVAVAELLLSKGAKINTPLHLAARKGSIEIVQLLLDKCADVNAKDPEGRTPLHKAIYYHNIEVVELLSRHACVNAADNDGMTPLHDAVRKGNLFMVKTLLKHGAEVNCVSTSPFVAEGFAPLHIAVQNGDEDVVSLLLSRGADVDAKMEGGVTPLHIAAGEGETRIAEELLNHGASIQPVTWGTTFMDNCVLSEGHMPLHSAVESGCVELVHLLLDRGADINATTSKSTPLHIAIKQGYDTVAYVLLERGAKLDQDEDGKTALDLAVERDHLTIVKMILWYCTVVNDSSNRASLRTAIITDGFGPIVEALLKCGLTLDSSDTNNYELLHTAVIRGYLKIVEDLLKLGADVNKLHGSCYYELFTPLHRAAGNSQMEVAECLLSHKADVNARDTAGKTPIFCAVQSSDIEITKLLLDNGADMSINPELICIAAEKGSFEMVEFLLQHGADVNTRDDCGRTPLHCTLPKLRHRECYDEYDVDIAIDGYAAREESSVRGSIANLLLSEGAFIDARTTRGWTTLHLASFCGFPEVVEVLLVRRANVNAKLEDGSTALHMASLEGHKLVVKLLLEYGAMADAEMMYTGQTPLHLAVKLTDVETAETLLKWGVDIDVKDGRGRSPLDYAIFVDCENVETLLQYGADINFMSVENQCSYGRPAVLRVLRSHIIKLNTAALYISDENVRTIRRFYGDEYDWDYRIYCGDYVNLERECKEEIARVMGKKIGDTTISFYDILSKSSSSLEICLRRENILQALIADDYFSNLISPTEFPIYARMVESNVRKGLERQELLVRGSKVFHFLSSNLPELPIECFEEIFCYLSNKDLGNFMEAFQPLLSSVERKELLGECSKMFSQLTHLPELPIAQIFSYLSNEDLRVLTKLCEPQSSIDSRA